MEAFGDYRDRTTGTVTIITTTIMVAVPRTIRSFKAKSYSHSYQINRVMGNYSGMDGMNLMTERYCDKERCFASHRKDRISMLGRPEFRRFVASLAGDGEVSEDEVIKALENAKGMLSEEAILLVGQ